MPSIYSPAQIAQVWQAAGGSAASTPMAVAIAMAESGGNPNASSRGGLGLGLWQIDTASGLQPQIDPIANARQAIQLSGNGANWHPWVTYNTGAYRQFYGDVGGGAAGPPPAAPAPAVSAPKGRRAPTGGVDALAAYMLESAPAINSQQTYDYLMGQTLQNALNQYQTDLSQYWQQGATSGGY